ncbi:unnamed protein product [Enterobius vermicularis]|uniref:Transposase n=1 Tax=Enterobius vermicularis TaxID=51028 RepID=A0A0N4UXL4_ENTVE|nr:unnamed protein product [Enterobius vermicularis]
MFMYILRRCARTGIIVCRRGSAPAFRVTASGFQSVTVVLNECLKSGEEKAHGTIKDMAKGYQRETVNHNLHFIGPKTGAYTNSTESLW